MISRDELGKIAIITKNRNITYRELFENINRYRQLFRNKGYKNVAIYSENRIEWIICFYAAWQENCTVVPIDFMAATGDVCYILNDCRPEVIFSSASMIKEVENVKEKINYKPEILIYDELDLTLENVELSWNMPADIEKTAVLIYTSGTTGSPKGVMLSFANLLANINGVTNKVPIFTSQRQVLILLPLHHIFPLAGSLLAPLYVGATVVMAPSMQSSDLMETLKNNEVGIMIGVPRLYELIYKGIKAKIDSGFLPRNLFKIIKFFRSKALAKKIFKKVHITFGGKLEIMVAGGAALNKEVGQFFKDLGFEILEGYGMTEASPMITFTRPGKLKIGSPGQPLPGMEVKIVDGEIIAKGPNIMKGYYNRPEETDEVLKDGWLYTGDLGYLDNKGYLWITGRKKEIIVLSNGKNINPNELELKLQGTDPCIKETGIFMHNEMIHAVIHVDYEILNEIHIEDTEQFFRKIILPEFNKEMTSYKRIMQFTLVNCDLPRTRLGKLQRFKLAEFTGSQKKEKIFEEHPQTEEYLAVKTFLESQVDMDISPNDHLEFDIALDSLGRISLIDFIEKTFGVTIEEDKLFKFPSIKSMAEYIGERKKWFKLDHINWTENLKDKVHVKLPKTWFTQNLIKNMAKGFFKIYFRFKGQGQENIPEGPCIFAPNHQSYFDGLFVISFFKRKTMRATYFYAKQERVSNRFLSFLADRNNVIVMDINSDLKESIQKLAEVLKNGKNIILFPEGTRSKDGQLGEFKKTFAILSTQLNIPVVPVVINGAFKALPTGSKFPRLFSKICVNFLPPVYPTEHSSDTLIQKVQELINSRLAY